MKPIESTEPKTMTYVGPSMNPMLQSGDQLHIIPYGDKRIRRGDVAVFTPPGDNTRIVHRVVSVDCCGLRTQGDNSKQVDQWTLLPDQVLGRVVFAQRGYEHRKVYGGLVGQLYGSIVKTINLVDSSVSSKLRPIYGRLARAGIFRRWLFERIQTRVVSFSRAAGTELQLLMGRRVIGRWLPGKTGWHIRRPFRLFVDEESLPENPGKGSVVRSP